ncbi:hypothetical protein PENFLA_c007G02436 [Penicillium flavigenum]|uniref:Uncharacterized protein n=1 Tax=Penicillium flavigenum TaxID=254877 RepID=A0A1V6TJF1_9EURO|nr:hypothetical protein PENFLA_c007G02436 [Penicillium flavigenum]
MSKDDKTPVPILYVKFELDATTRQLRTNDKGISIATWAHCVDIAGVQGSVSYDKKFYISSSNGRTPKTGDPFTWEQGETTKEHKGWFMAGNEDLGFNSVRKEYYAVTDYDGGRYILACQGTIG